MGDGDGRMCVDLAVRSHLNHHLSWTLLNISKAKDRTSLRHPVSPICGLIASHEVEGEEDGVTSDSLFSTLLERRPLSYAEFTVRTVRTVRNFLLLLVDFR